MNKLGLLFLMLMSALLGTGCAGVTKQLTAITVLEHSALGKVHDFTTIATEAVALLPVDQQASRRAQITAASSAITTAMSAKDVAMQDAAAANSLAGIDFGKLTQDVITAVQAFVALVDLIGNDVAATKAVAGAPTDVVQKLHKSTQEVSAALIVQQMRVKAALAQ